MREGQSLPSHGGYVHMMLLHLLDRLHMRVQVLVEPFLPFFNAPIRTRFAIWPSLRLLRTSSFRVRLPRSASCLIARPRDQLERTRVFWPRCFALCSSADLQSHRKHRNTGSQHLCSNAKTGRSLNEKAHQTCCSMIVRTKSPGNGEAFVVKL